MAVNLNVLSGGNPGGPILVLLHGIGANSTVWKPMLPLIEKEWPGRWIAPDLRGHGQSPFEEPYEFEIHAADVAQILAAEQAAPIFLVGHSFGGAVAAQLAIGSFGSRIAGVFAFSVKLHWTPLEVAKSEQLSIKPRRAFDTPDEAIKRFLDGAGLYGLLDPTSDDARAAIVENNSRYEVRLDPRVFGGSKPDFPALFRQVDAPLRLAAGDRDPMVTLDQMRNVDPGAFVFADAGHNVHFEKPTLVWSEVSRFLASVQT